MLSHQRLSGLLLCIVLATTSSASQTGAYCPLVPQTGASPAASFLDPRIVDFTGIDIKRSTLLRVANADAQHLIVLDGHTLENKEAVGALRQSKATVMLRTHEGADAALHLLDRPIRNISVLAAIPSDTAGVGKVYRPETATYPAVVKQYASTANKLRALPATTVMSAAPVGGNIRDAVIHSISTGGPDDLLLLVAHNMGGELKLPDGSTVTTAEIARISAERDRPVLILSCETIDADVKKTAFVTTRPLYFDEITAALNSALALATRRDQTMDLSTIVREINQTLAGDSPRGRHALVAVAVIASTVLMMIVLTEEICERDQNGDCKH